MGARLDRARTVIRRTPLLRTVLLDWASHAVADSQRFFETPDTSDYTFSPGVDGATGAVSFPSAMLTPYPENNTVHALYFRAGSQSKTRPTRGGRVRAGPARAAAGALFSCCRNGMPGPDGHVGLCRLLNRFGLSALRLTLPYHDARTARRS